MRKLFSFSVIALLAACTGNDAPPPQVATAPIPEETVQTPQEEPAPIVLPNTELLIGHTPRTVQSQLGEPNLVRRDGNVQIMLYEASSCVFEVIFYEKNPDEHFRATDINARTAKGYDVDRDECLATVLGTGVTLDLTTPDQ